MFFQRAKIFYKSCTGTVWFLIPYLVFGVYPTLVHWANPAPPENQLQWISAKVVNAQQNHPNLRVEMPDGSIRDLDFYANLFGIFRGLPRFSETDQELSKLQGCQAQIGVDSIRWLILPHNQRIWEVRCESYPLSYAILIAKYQFHRKLGVWLCAGSNGFMILGITILFIFERRKNRRPNQWIQNNFQ